MLLRLKYKYLTQFFKKKSTEISSIFRSFGVSISIFDIDIEGLDE